MGRPTTTARILGAVAAAALLSACQTAREQEVAVKPEIAHAYLDDKPAELRKHFFVKLTQGKRNDVLNDMRLGLAAMEMGQPALAEALFDEALVQIETIYADNEAAAKARGLFTKERVKDFKGEPYERAMAYYYRGLLYLKAGDYDNARASFKGGYIQDSFAEEDQYQADFGLLSYLQGWASRCRGNTATAEEDFKEFRAANPTFPLPKPGDNLLLLVETGSAPVKFSGSDPNSTKPRYLKMRRASATETARLKLGPAPAPLEMLEDVYRQASTRGGREFDAILAGKAQFKDFTNTAGNAMLVAGAGALTYATEKHRLGSREREDGTVAAVGLGLLVTGLIAKGISEATEADADTRYWDNLPDRVHAMTMAAPAGLDVLPVEFVASDGSTVRIKDAAINHAGPCGLAWVRGESALPWSPRAPASAPSEDMIKAVIIPPLPGDEPAEDIKYRPPSSGDQGS